MRLPPSDAARQLARSWARLLARVARLTGRHAIEFFFPRVCPECGQTADRAGRTICWNCFSGIEIHAGIVCDRCGLAPAGAVTGAFVCGACRQDPPAFDRACSAAAFRGTLRDALLAFKYHRATWLLSDLADLLHGGVTSRLDAASIDAVVPVPLHPSRQRERTYNQAEMLAADLARRLGVPCRAAAMVRCRLTRSQTRLGAAERRRNVAGAFAVADAGGVRGRTLLVVDDVMTTGATLHETARELRRAGAWRIYAATVARG
jgi:ComF family protein